MGKRKQKLKPDIVVKNYWRNNEQFADFFNAVLFDGKEIIKADELEDIDTEESSILEHKDYAESIGAARDNVKIRKKSTIYNVELVILGMEGQERIHYAMPMRVMGYDYGENPWDGALSLHEMLNIPKEVEPFVNDYKMHLIEARKNNLKLHNINNIDLFNLLEILLNKDEKLKETKEKAIQYASEHDVDKSVIMTVAGAANCKMDYDMIAGKGSVDMCTVFEETRFEGRLEGRLEGKLEGRAEEIIETGHEFGLSEEEILIRLQKKLDVSLQKAQEYFKMFSK